MNNLQRRNAAASALRILPVHWAIAIVVVIIAYVLLQPRINQWFGWHLPSVPAMLGEEKKPKTKASISKPDKASKHDQLETNSKSGGNSNPENTPSKKKSEESTKQDSYPTFGFLKSIGRSRYASPAGLIYAPGSEEGHRLKHIERHLSDQPNRPGSHGVFEGEMKDFLEAIDDAYLRARGRAKGTTRREEEGSDVYEAPFVEKIGFMGGEEGAEKNHPPLKRMRIVVRGDQLITAFPVK